VASRGRHTRSTPQLPLATPEVDLEKIIRRQRTLQEGSFTAEPSDSGNFHSSPIAFPVVVSHFPVTPSVGASKNLNFGSVPVDFPSPSFTTLPPVKAIGFAERETSVPSSPEAFSPDPHLFPSVPRSTPPISPV
jgi:hypothetical protein